MQRKLFWASLLVLLLALPGYASSADSLESLLGRADSIRSSKPKEFSELLDQARRHPGKATQTQRERLRYLEAYEAGVYRDRLDLGISIAKELFKKTKSPEMRYRAGSLVANYSAIKRDFGVGLRFLESTLALRESVVDKDVRHEGIGAGAMLYNQFRQHAVALRYSEELLADAPSARMKCVGSHFMIEAKQELGTLDEDKDAVMETIAQCVAINEFIPANLIRATLAKKWLKEGRLEQAEALLKDSLEQVEATHYPRLIAEIRSILAEVELQKGKTGDAEANAKAAILLSDQVKASASLVSAYQTLYRISESRSKAVEALDFYKKFAMADRDYRSDIKARELAYEIFRQDTQKKNQQIQLLERQNEVLQLEQELDKQSALKARLAMVFLMLVLAAVIYWMLQIKRHQRQLQRLAQTDMLTGVGNRHYFTLKSEKALVEAAREGEQAALVMFDLDHFKAINDTYGHGAGDWVLKQVGRVCRTHCRKTDYLGRVGGEEFAVLLRGVDLAEAARIAEDCRSTLAQIDTRESGYSFVVTGSFGVSSTGQSGYDLSRLMSHADQMLYRAKHEGRNRVCVYAPDSQESKSGRRSTPALTVVGR